MTVVTFFTFIGYLGKRHNSMEVYRSRSHFLSHPFSHCITILGGSCLFVFIHQSVYTGRPRRGDLHGVEELPAVGLQPSVTVYDPHRILRALNYIVRYSNL